MNFITLLFSFIVAIMIGLLYIFSDNKTKPPTSEKMVCSALREVTGNFVLENIRPKFLKNPKTKRNLELDCYDPFRKVAVEYDGIQHYTYPNPFHRTRRDFDKQQERDKLKDNLCRKNNIQLIRIPYHQVPSGLSHFHKKEFFKNYLLSMLN
jgi:hypothetical protein